MSSHVLDTFSAGALTIEHLRSMVTLRIQEDETLEFKQQLNLKTDGEKKEFCKDVSALANTRGGYLIFGVEEDADGRAAALPGIPFSSQDEDLIYQVITSGVTPRVQRFAIQKIAVDTAQTSFVVVLHIDPDGSLHQVKYGSDRCYRRVGKITIVMEPSDFAAFFRATTKSADRNSEILSARREFEGMVKGGRFFGLELRGGAVALSIFPEHFPNPINLTDPGVDWLANLIPLYCAGWDRQYRSDSVITFGTAPGANHPYSVAQMTALGEIKAANSFLLSNERHFELRLPEGALGYVPSVAFEREIILSAHRYLNLLAKLDVNGPWRVGISLLNVRGYIMFVSPFHSPPRDRIVSDDDFVAPQCVIANRNEITTQADVAKGLKPAFDFIWRGFGFRGSLNYDEQSNWSDSRQ